MKDKKKFLVVTATGAMAIAIGMVLSGHWPLAVVLAGIWILLTWAVLTGRPHH